MVNRSSNLSLEFVIEKVKQLDLDALYHGLITNGREVKICSFVGSNPANMHDTLHLATVWLKCYLKNDALYFTYYDDSINGGLGSPSNPVVYIGMNKKVAEDQEMERRQRLLIEKFL